MTPRPGPSPDRPPPHPSETHRSVRRAVALWLDAGLECTSRQKTKFSPPRRRRRWAAVPHSLGPARRWRRSPAVRASRTWADFLVVRRTTCNWKEQQSMSPQPSWRGNPPPPPAALPSRLACEPGRGRGLSAVSVAKRWLRPVVVSCILCAAGGSGGGPARTGRWGPDLGFRPLRRAHYPIHHEQTHMPNPQGVRRETKSQLRPLL